MTYHPASFMLCLWLAVALSVGPKFGRASSWIRSPSSRQGPSRSSPDFGRAPISLTLTNANATNATTPTQSPTPATAPTGPVVPTPPPTHPPTKKYESPEDEEEEEEEEKKERSKAAIVWILVSIALICTGCYFRNSISFFFVRAWDNTQRYGRRGCLQSFFPCFLRSRLGAGGGSEPLDQIIFETEDNNAPLMS